MKKQKPARTPAVDNPGSGNVTHERLAALPFKSAKALKEAQEQIRLSVWRRMEEAKVIHEMINRKEFAFWHHEFKQGLVCSYEEKADASLVRVYSEGDGIRISINRGLAAAAPSSEAVLGALVRSMSESFATTYYRAKGILYSPDSSSEDTKKAKGVNGS